jgi:tetratricopeptide (TPR) repeat protein
MTSLLKTGCALWALSLAGTIQAQELRPNVPDRFELGRDARGEPCVAARSWNDTALPGYFSDSFSITCRGATASRSLGTVRAFKSDLAEAVERTLQCGEASSFNVPDIGAVRARRCIDKALGFETVVTSFERGKRRFAVSAIATAQGPAEEALRVVAMESKSNPDRTRKSAAAVNVAALAAAPGASAADALAVDTTTALQQGLRFVRQGLHMEASRVLNDALSRLPTDAPVAQRVDLLLVSALADSNLRFFDSAAESFTRADQLLADNPSMENAGVLARKRTNYAALDLLNRRNFENAIRSLDRLTTGPADASQPLSDPTLVRSLNQRAEGSQDSSGSVAVPDVATLSQLVIDAQAQWARSVALLAQNKPEDARVAIDAADRSFAVLRRERVDQRQVLWLEARIERQRGRVLSRLGDNAGALAALDRAISSLNRAGSDGSGIGPTLAETRMERAALASRSGADRAAVLAQFDGAVDSLVSSGASGSVLPPSIEQYLDLLVADAEARPDGNAGERFFRAIQAVGEPAVARQFTQLQSIVTADQSLAARVQDRSELEREITQLRFQIAEAPADNAAAVKALEDRRAAAETQLVAIDGELQGSNAFSAVDDRPATIAEIRAALKPGEAFFKVTEIRNYAFGILIDAQGYRIYRVARPVVDLRPLADVVRASIDGGADGKLPVFNVAGAYALFQLAAGPVAERLLSATTVVVDPSGPFEKLPLGVLVTDRASVEAFAASRGRDAYNYSAVNFLSKRVALSSALSPRSFLVARKLPASAAPNPFMGFAQHMPIPMTASIGGQAISIGTNCIVERRAIAQLSNALKPIDARELNRATAALGIANPPELTGAAFSDTAVLERTDLNQFQVLHFATHGLTEGQWGCRQSPPALVTSMGGEGSDGILSFGEIAKLRLDANLVVLSACDTASGVSSGEARAAGQEESGATLEGLVRAFLAANTRAVLTTYWPISDEGESEALIENFYRAGRAAPVAAALKTAQVQMMTAPKSSHPIYWGAFFVVGDASKAMLSGTAMAAVAR